MDLSSSQTIQSRNPLDTSSTRRVNSLSRPSAADAEEGEKNKLQQNKIDQEEQRMLQQLRARDREVRSHEAAHVAAGGSLVRGGASYTYQRGPDGRSYAIGGEVNLDVSSEDDPEANLRKAEQIRSAALAPANPSPQDMRVAANASQMAARARVDIAVQRREEAQEAVQKQLDESESLVQSAAENSDKTEMTDESVQNNVAGNVDQNTQVSSQAINLKSSDQPAAISAFMATAQTEPVPARFNQFV